MNKVTKSVLILLLRIIVWFALYLIGMIISGALIVGTFVITHNEILSFVTAFPALPLACWLTIDVPEMVDPKLKELIDD